jgi:streptogramin lyase
VTTFSLHLPASTSAEDTPGIVSADGALWVTEISTNSIYRVSTSGDIHAYRIPTLLATPGGITADPSGNLWFTEISKDKIARLTPGGTFHEISLPHGSLPYDIAYAAGNLWVDEHGTNRIARVAPNASSGPPPPVVLHAGPLTLRVIPDPEAPAGAVPKVTFKLSPVHPGRKYYIQWDLVGSRGSAHCTQLGATIENSSGTQTLSLGPAPYGSYGDSTYRGFCAHRRYRLKVYQQVSRFHDTIAARFPFTAPGPA